MKCIKNEGKYAVGKWANCSVPALPVDLQNENCMLEQMNYGAGDEVSVRQSDEINKHFSVVVSGTLLLELPTCRVAPDYIICFSISYFNQFQLCNFSKVKKR